MFFKNPTNSLAILVHSGIEFKVSLVARIQSDASPCLL